MFYTMVRTKKVKKGIPFDHTAAVMGLWVAVLITFQQIAVIIMKHYFIKWGASVDLAGIFAYILSLLMIMYYINKIIHSYREKKR